MTDKDEIIASLTKERDDARLAAKMHLRTVEVATACLHGMPQPEQAKPTDLLAAEFQLVTKNGGTELWLEFKNGAVCLNNIANERGPITRKAMCAAIERHLTAPHGESDKTVGSDHG